MRFTIRDLLWLTVVVALGVGWGIDRWRLRDEVTEEYNLYYDRLTESLVEAADRAANESGVEVTIRAPDITIVGRPNRSAHVPKTPKN